MSIRGILFLLYQVVVIATIIHVLMDNRQQAKTVAWALVIWFVPVVGILAYIFFGVNIRRERMVGRRSMDQLTKRSMLQFVEQRDLQLPDAHKPVIDLFVNESFSLPFGGNKVDILTSGYEFFPSLLRDISLATSHVHIGVYIFEDDALGHLIADALIAKAQQGVEVRLVYDDVGCWQVANSFFERMRREGIEAEPFMPVRFPSFARRANYRNHRKVFVIDGRVGYIGGMNIAVRYVKGGKGNEEVKEVKEVKELSSWRDTMLRVEGRGVYSLQRTFLIDWYFVDRTLLSDRKYYPQFIDHSPLTIDHSDAQPTVNGQWSMFNGQWSMFNGQCSMFNGQCSMFNATVQTVTSGPTSPYPEIMQGFVRIIMAARSYVYIETPYFLPTSVVLYAMKSAAQSGVDVRLLVPARGDARFIDWASRSYLREATDAGIKVSFYQTGFLHSKLLVCDDSVCTCGSTNVDFRSFENNFEANTFFYDETLAREFRQIFLNDEAQSITLNKSPKFQDTHFIARLGESLTRLFSPLL